MRKNVAFLITSLDFGGAESAIAGLIDRLKARKDISLVIISVYGTGRMREKLLAEGVKILNIYDGFPGKFQRFVYFFYTVLKLRSLLVSEKIGLLVSFLFEPAMLSRLAGFLLFGKVRVLNSVRASRQSMNDTAEFFYLFLEKLTHNLVRKYIFVSRAAMDYLVSRAGIAEDKCAVIANGVDTRRFLPVEKRTGYIAQKMSLEPAAVIIGSVGRLCSHKGYEYFILAARDVLLLDNSVRFIIVGEGPAGEKLSGLIKTLGLDEKILILPFTGEIDKIYGGLDIFVSSSLSEGMSNTLLEAMATGRPIVATDIPANRELLTDGENAVLVKEKDSAALSSGIIRLLNDRALMEKTGSAARNSAETYDLGLAAGKWSDLIEKETA